MGITIKLSLAVNCIVSTEVKCPGSPSSATFDHFKNSDNCKDNAVQKTPLRA